MLQVSQGEKDREGEELTAGGGQRRTREARRIGGEKREDH